MKETVNTFVSQFSEKLSKLDKRIDEINSQLAAHNKYTLYPLQENAGTYYYKDKDKLVTKQCITDDGTALYTYLIQVMPNMFLKTHVLLFSGFYCTF